MGLCASKESNSQDEKPSSKVHRSHQTEKPSKLPQVAKSDNKKPNTGKKLSTAVQQENDLPARLAAGQAAAERFEKSQKSMTKGELSKKLAEERAKTHQTHLKETAETRQREKSQPLLYD